MTIPTRTRGSLCRHREPFLPVLLLKKTGPLARLCPPDLGSFAPEASAHTWRGATCRLLVIAQQQPGLALHGVSPVSQADSFGGVGDLHRGCLLVVYSVDCIFDTRSILSMILNIMEVTTPITETVAYILGLIQSALVLKDTITRYWWKRRSSFPTLRRTPLRGREGRVPHGEIRTTQS